MKKKKATNKAASSPKSQTNDSSSQLQRARILKMLKAVGGIGLTTIQIREELDCMHPAGRIKELRDQGHDIRTIRTFSANAQGKNHANACYVLISSKGVAA